MPDREKVILQCKRAIDTGESVTDYCFYYDVITMLKEQEPIAPVMKKGHRFTSPACARCGYFFPTGTKPKYCNDCGQAVKWD